MNDHQLEIKLRERVLTMHGTPEESVGSVLSGSLIFNALEATKVNSICLKFEGRLELKGAKDILVEKRTLVHHTWTFLESRRNPHALGPNKHVFNFELPLSGDLPESVKVDYGKIVYQLVAVVKRPGLFKDIKSKRDVTIQRAFLPCMQEYTNNSTITGTWENFLEYSISSPSPSYTFGDTIPINIALRPKPGHPSFRVLKVKVSLNEHTIYKTNGEINGITRVQEIANNFHDSFHTEANCINDTINLYIPRIARNDCLTNFISVSHKLMVHLYMIDDHQRRRVLYSGIPVVIQTNSQLEVSQSPPNYLSFAGSFDQMCMPPPYYDFDQYSSSEESV